MSERDPAEIYGPILTPSEIEAKDLRAAMRSLPGMIKGPDVQYHGPKSKRTLTLTLHAQPNEDLPRLQLSQVVVFNDLSSPTQFDAVMDTLSELDYRLSLALGTLRVSPGL